MSKHYNPPTPFSLSLGGLHPKQRIVIGCIPNVDAKRITFDFEMNSGDDIAFHFNIRFDYLGYTNTIIRNSRVGSVWGSEERHMCTFPFTPNKYHEVEFLIEQDRFKVSINSQPCLEFGVRVPLPSIDRLGFYGDVRLTHVQNMPAEEVIDHV